MSAPDIINRIDQLVDDEKCPHCERDWHEQALTSKVAQMFESGRLDPNYFAYQDNSRVVCDGSRFIGPSRPEPIRIGRSTRNVIFWVDEAIAMATNYAQSQFPKFYYEQSWTFSFNAYTQKFLLGAKHSPPWVTFHDKDWNTLWSTKSDPEPLEDICDDVPDVNVEFGPQNWEIVDKPVYLTPAVMALVSKRWLAFKRDETPMPTPIAMDLKPIAEKFNDQFIYFKEKK